MTSLRRTKKFFEEFRSHLVSSGRGADALLASAAAYCFRHFASDLVYIEDSRRGHSAFQPSHADVNLLREIVVSERDSQLMINGEPCTFPLIIPDTRYPEILTNTCRRLRREGIRSLCVVPMYSDSVISGYIAMASKGEIVEWTSEDGLLCQFIAEVLEARLRSTASISERVDSSSESRQEKLQETIPFAWLRTDENRKIIELSGGVESLFGYQSSQLLQQVELWEKLLHPDDSRELGRFVRRMVHPPYPFSREIRIRNLRTGRYRWVSLKAWPVFQDNTFVGWDALIVDASQRRQNQEILLSQSRRLEALYSVSRSLQVNAGPAQITLKGLRAIMGATNADAGFGCFFDESRGKIEIVASRGLSEDYLNQVSVVVDGKSLVRFAIENRTGLLIDNIQRDQRASTQVAKIEDVKGTIIAPMMFEDEVFGALALFNRKAKSFTNDDLDLLTAAASQIGMASRRAEFYLEQKRQSDWLAALYDLSHALSEVVTPEEVAAKSFERFRRHVQLKRVWMGVVSESGTHLLAQATSGEGVPNELLDVQLDLRSRDDAVATAVREKRSIFTRVSPGELCDEFKVNYEGDEPTAIAIVPMIALGRVVGVIAFEPVPGREALLQSKLALLSTLANEVAGFLLARRMESRIAEAEKMRMASFFAAGVAHNFNNLLQAVMGQASLIEMQSPEESPYRESARQIIESAGKGAALIKQLLGLSHQGAMLKRRINLAEIVRESKELYQSIVGPEVSVSVDLDAPEIFVEADSAQVQQVITNLLVNAKEAVSDVSEKKIQVRARMLNQGSEELSPDLPVGPYALVQVVDSGRGMDVERRARCFEPFFTTKEVDSLTGLGLSGSGLGLSTAYSIIKQHEGDITVESALGQGASFSIFLPLVASASRNSGDVVGFRSSALIFDQEDTGSSSLRATLESLGLRTRVLADEDRMLEILGEEHGRNVLVFLDGDHYGFGLEKFVSQALSTNPKALIVVSSVDISARSKAFASLSNVHVVEKPIGLIAIKSFLSRVIPQPRDLRSQIEVSRVDDAASSTKDPDSVQSGNKSLSSSKTK